MDIFIENGWYDMYMYDLIAFKINGPRFALIGIEEKYKEEMFMLIKKDYLQIKSSEYYPDYMNNLGPVKKKFMRDVLSSNNYSELNLK